MLATVSCVQGLPKNALTKHTVRLSSYPKNPFTMTEKLYSSVFICVYLWFQLSCNSLFGQLTVRIGSYWFSSSPSGSKLFNTEAIATGSRSHQNERDRLPTVRYDKPTIIFRHFKHLVALW